MPRGARTVRAPVAVVTSATWACRRRRPGAIVGRGVAVALCRPGRPGSGERWAARCGRGSERRLPEALEPAEEQEQRRAASPTQYGPARAARSAEATGATSAAASDEQQRRRRSQGARRSGRGSIVYSSVPQAASAASRTAPARSELGERPRSRAPRTRSLSVGGDTRPRTSAWTASRAAEERSGRRNSSASQAASSSTAEHARGVRDDPRRLPARRSGPSRRGPPCRPRWGSSRRSPGGRAPCSRRRAPPP